MKDNKKNIRDIKSIENSKKNDRIKRQCEPSKKYKV